MEALLKDIGLDLVGHYEDNNTYVVELKDSDEFGKVFNKLDKCEFIDEIENESSITIFSSKLLFESDNHIIELTADFDADTYFLIVKDR